jgi:O-antigen/teichoic acid export membrane protein
MTSRLSRNTLTLLTSNAGSAVLSFLLSILIGRALGQDGLGVYSTALAWVFPLSLIADFGLSTLMTRDIALDPALTSTYLNATTRPRLWIGGLLTIGLILFAPLLSNDPSVVAGLRISAPLIIILPSFGAFTAIFRARQVMWPIPWLNLGMLVAQVILTTVVFLLGGGVLAALVVNTVTSAGQVLVAWIIYRIHFRKADESSLSPSRDKDENLTGLGFALLKRAWPFALAGVLAALQARAGTILLEQLTDTVQVGYYAAAARFVEAARTIPNALFGALFPALAALALQPVSMQHLFRRVLLGLSAFGFAVALVFMGFSPLVISLTYGDSFLLASLPLQIAMWGLLPGLLRAGWTLYWYARGREQLTNLVTGIALVVQVCTSLWLIPLYGASGAALAGLLTETIALILICLPGIKSWRNA